MEGERVQTVLEVKQLSLLSFIWIKGTDNLASDLRRDRYVE